MRVLVITMSGLQHQFWVTRGAILRSLGSKDDDNVVQSDAELDARLELFKTLTVTSHRLGEICQHLYDNIRYLSESETTIGQFLTEFCRNETNDTVCNILQVTSKAFDNCGSQRLLTTSSVARLHHDLQIFQSQAIVDCRHTIDDMEKLRTEYRAALNWMKSESKNLDPEAMHGMEPFRKVQNQVRISKTKFDQMKLNCLQKIDFLTAARCNLFSYCLMVYQQEFFQFVNGAYLLFANAAAKLSQIQTLVDNRRLAEVKEMTKPTIDTKDQNQEDVGVTDHEKDNNDLLLDFNNEPEDYWPSKLIQSTDTDSVLTLDRDRAQNNTKKITQNIGDKTASSTSLNAQLSWLHLFEDLDPLSKINLNNHNNI